MIIEVLYDEKRTYNSIHRIWKDLYRLNNPDDTYRGSLEDYIHELTKERNINEMLEEILSDFYCDEDIKILEILNDGVKFMRHKMASQTPVIEYATFDFLYNQGCYKYYILDDEGVLDSLLDFDETILFMAERLKYNHEEKLELLISDYFQTFERRMEMKNIEK